jgi:UrcA family protein
MRTLKMAVAAACLLTAAAGQAMARDEAPAREASSDRISTATVDFRDAAQVRDFHKRLQQTALFVCGVQPDVTSRKQREADRACAEGVVRAAVDKLDRPLLTATYQQAGAPMVARGY